jgi:hypothetical protein
VKSLRESEILDARLDFFGRAALSVAGFRPEHVRRAFNRVLESLDARRVTRVPTGGGAVRTFKDPDHDIRFRAATEVLHLADAYPKADAAASGPAINIQVNVLGTDGSVRRVEVRGGT